MKPDLRALYWADVYCFYVFQGPVKIFISHNTHILYLYIFSCALCVIVTIQSHLYHSVIKHRFEGT